MPYLVFDFVSARKLGSYPPSTINRSFSQATHIMCSHNIIVEKRAKRWYEAPRLCYWNKNQIWSTSVINATMQTSNECSWPINETYLLYLIYRVSQLKFTFPKISDIVWKNAHTGQFLHSLCNYVLFQKWLWKICK